MFDSSARRWPVILTGLALSTAQALASEHAAPKAAAAPAPAASEPKALPGEGGHAAARPPPAFDPMDRLRERLAQKLGAAKPPGAENPNLLRIVSKSSAPGHGDADLVTTPSAAHAALAQRTRRAPPAAPAAHPVGLSGIEPGQARWDYAGAGGPESWGQLKPEFNRCASGKRQSPIDIEGGIRVDLDPVNFDYRTSGFKVIDNGHTVQVNVGPGSSIEVMGHRYDLIQFHFHRPSEERINGRQYDMAVHLVHRDLDGRLAFVAVLLDRGSALPAVQSVWNNLPLEKGEEVLARGLLNPADLLPADRSYYTYMGSLTTPPCSEGVLWMVMKRPMPVSPEQVGIFARLYPMNARPIQASAGRLIKESN